MSETPRHNAILPIISSARPSRAVEAGLQQVPDCSARWSMKIRVAGGIMPVECRRPVKRRIPIRVKALRDTMRAEGVPIRYRSSWLAACGSCASGTTGSTIRSSARSPFSRHAAVADEEADSTGLDDALRELEPGDILLHKFSRPDLFLGRPHPFCAARGAFRPSDPVFGVEAGEHTCSSTSG